MRSANATMKLDSSMERSLLIWCQEATIGYHKVDIRNFSTSWRDGLAFNALIHYYRPDLFDYSKLLHNDSNRNLEHAFRLAQEHFAVDRLLRFEDVDTTDPDTSKIISYITQLYHALPHSEPISTSQTSKHSLKSSRTSSNESSQHSVVSVDLNSYQESLESVLGWLLEAEEKLSAQQMISTDVRLVKQQFEKHEQFLLELSSRQSGVGNVLQEGNQLVIEGKVNMEEENEIRIQLNLLNNRWEQLRTLALKRQALLQQTLMRLQQEQLDTFETWLSEFEAKLETKQPTFQSAPAVKSRLRYYKSLQVEIEKQQECVQNLQNLVVIVDESVDDQTSACTSLESQLDRVGRRWSNLIRTVEQDWLMLSDLYNKWSHFDKEQQHFAQWVNEKITAMNKSQGNSITDEKNALEIAHQLKSIDQQMDFQVRRFDDLNDLGQEIVSLANEDPVAVSQINMQLEECQNQWESLLQKMEIQSKRIAQSESLLQGASGAEAGYRQDEIGTGVSLETSIKKPRLELIHQADFDDLTTKLNAVCDKIRSNAVLLDEQNPTLSINEKLALAEDSIAIMNESHVEYEQMQKLGQHLADELIAAGQSTVAVEESVADLEQRWRVTETNLNELARQISSSRAVSEMGTLQKAIIGFEQWINEAETAFTSNPTEIGEQLEQCRLKLKSMRAQDELLEALNKQLHRSGAGTPPHIISDLKVLRERSASLQKRMETRAVQLSSQMEPPTPPRNLTEKMEALSKWLGDVEAVVSGEPFQLNKVAQMQDQLQQYTELEAAVKEYEPNLKTINKNSDDLLSNPEIDQGIKEKMESDVRHINEEWHRVGKMIMERKKKLAESITQVKKLFTQMDGLEKWADDMGAFLGAIELNQTDPDTLQAQLRESDGVEDDIKTLQKSVDDIETSVNKMIGRSEKEFQEPLKDRLEQMKEKWTSIVKVSRNLNNNIGGLLDNNKKVLERMAELNLFAGNLLEEYNEIDKTPQNPEQLQQCIAALEKLNSKLTNRQEDLDALQQTLSQPTDNKNLGQSWTVLRERWDELSDKLSKNVATLQECDKALSELMQRVSSENEWLDSLDAKISQSPGTGADAEETSEQMDALENFVHSHGENGKQRITELGEILVSKQVCLLLVTEQLDKFLNRWTSLCSAARARVQQLEEMVQRAQNLERTVLEFRQWCQDVGKHLQQQLDADLLAGDLPDEFKTLKAEFGDHESFLATLEKQVDEYKNQGKTEAADRLQGQLTLLRTQYKEVHRKFVRFQRPADFEPKLTYVKRILDEIEERIYLLEIRNHEPDEIQAQLDHCMKFYRRMSELKGEVEYVIRTGRQVVDRKQVDFPEKTSSQLDAIKHQYNDLGAQITHGKTELEKSLKLCKNLKKHTTQIIDVRQRIEQELETKQGIIGNPPDEIRWVEKSQSEMNRRDSALKMANYLFDELTKLAEKDTMKEAKESLDMINLGWEELKNKLIQRKAWIEEQQSLLEALFSEYQTTLRDINKWIARANQSMAVMDTREQQELVSEQSQRKLNELTKDMTEIGPQIDILKDLSSRLLDDERYRIRIDPQITRLEREWTDACARIKDKVGILESMIGPNVNREEETMRAISELADNMVSTVVAMVMEDMEKAAPPPEEFKLEQISSEPICDKSTEEVQVQFTSTQNNITVFVGQLDQLLIIKDDDSVGSVRHRVDEITDQHAQLQREMQDISAKATEERLNDSSDINAIELCWLDAESKFQSCTEEMNLLLDRCTGHETECRNMMLHLGSVRQLIYEGKLESAEEKAKGLYTVYEKLSKEGEFLIARKCRPLIYSIREDLDGLWSDVCQMITHSQLAQQTAEQVVFEAVQMVEEDKNDQAERRLEQSPAQERLSPARGSISRSKVSFSMDPKEFSNEVSRVLEIIVTEFNALEALPDLDVPLEQNSRLIEIRDKLRGIQPEIEMVDLHADEILSDSSDSRKTRELIGKIKVEWNRVNKAYSEKHTDWMTRLNDWQRLQCDIRELLAWLTAAEELLATSSMAEGGIDYRKANIIQKELEEGLSFHNEMYESIIRLVNDIAGSSDSTEGRNLKNKVDTIVQQWKQVSREVDERKARISDASNQINAWLDLAENLHVWIIQLVELVRMQSAVDVHQLGKFSSAMNEKRSDVQAALQQGELLLSTYGDNEEVREKLSALKHEWLDTDNSLKLKANVQMNSVDRLRSLLVEICDQSMWLQSTCVKLAKHQDDIDVKAVQSQLDAKLLIIEEINERSIEIHTDAADSGFDIPVDLCERINDLAVRWKDLIDTASMIRSNWDITSQLEPKELRESLEMLSEWAEIDGLVKTMQNWMMLFRQLSDLYPSFFAQPATDVIQKEMAQRVEVSPDFQDKESPMRSRPTMNFASQLEDFFFWLESVEEGIMHLDNKAIDQTSRAEAVEWVDKSNNLQTEIENHQMIFDQLANSTKVPGFEDNTERVRDLSDRWGQLKLRSDQLRNRMEGSQKQWSEVLQELLELTQWCVSTDEGLTRLLPVADSFTGFRNQYDLLRRIEGEVNSRRAAVNDKMELVPEFLDAEEMALENGMPQDIESQSLVHGIRFHLRLLSRKWAKINQSVEDLNSRYSAVYEQFETFEKLADEVCKSLNKGESSVARWLPMDQVSLSNIDPEINHVRDVQQKVAPIQGRIEAIDNSTALLRDLGVNLCAGTQHRIKELNDRWISLQQVVEKRLRYCHEAARNFGPDSQHFLIDSVEHPWERAVAGNRVPYYINHTEETTHWDHPDMTKFFKKMTDINNVRLSAYRTSMKVRALQKFLGLDLLPMHLAVSTFDKFGLRSDSSFLSDCPDSERVVGVMDIVKVMSSIYETLAAECPEELGSVSKCTDLILNWLLNVYDINRIGEIRSLSFKAAIILLCRGHLDEKYRYLFKLVAEKERTNEQQFGSLLYECIQITRQLGEVAAFGGSNVEPSVKSCFQLAGNPSNGINVHHFLEWVRHEPQSLVWMPVLHRLAASEMVKHQAKCNICKMFPIVGFRYRCLRCFNFDVCQSCFFTGCRAKSHKLNHPMQEYCVATTSGEDVRDFTKVLKNKFRSKDYFRKKKPLGYLPVQTVVEGTSFKSLSPRMAKHSYDEMHSRIGVYAARLDEIEKLDKNVSEHTESEDEHTLIAQYCHTLNGDNASNTQPLRSPVQIMLAVDAEQKSELEAMIQNLETENKNLLNEYERLKNMQQMGHVAANEEPLQNGNSSDAYDSQDEEMLSEAKVLRQHKGRLETRMHILEDHNKQLETQLTRLRQMLSEDGGSQSKIDGQNLVASWDLTSPRTPRMGDRASMERHPPSYPHDEELGLSGSPSTSRGSSLTRGRDDNVENLLQMAGEVSKAVGSLVTCMNDNDDDDDDIENSDSASALTDSAPVR